MKFVYELNEDNTSSARLYDGKGSDILVFSITCPTKSAANELMIAMAEAMWLENNEDMWNDALMFLKDIGDQIYVKELHIEEEFD